MRPADLINLKGFMARICVLCNKPALAGALTCNVCGGPLLERGDPAPAATAPTATAPPAAPAAPAAPRVARAAASATQPWSMRAEVAVHVEFEGSTPFLPIYGPAILRARCRAGVDELIAALRPGRNGENRGSVAVRDVDAALLVKKGVKKEVAIASDAKWFLAGGAEGFVAYRYQAGQAGLQPVASGTMKLSSGVELGNLRIFVEQTPSTRELIFETRTKLETEELDLGAFQIVANAIRGAWQTHRWVITLPDGSPGRPKARARPTRPALLYAGLVVMFVLWALHGQGWSPPLVSYAWAMSLAFGMAVIGGAVAAFQRQNATTGWGVLAAGFSVLAAAHEWALPLVETFHVPLYLGLFLMAIGMVPGLLGVPTLAVGALTLVAGFAYGLNGGFAAVPWTVWVFGVILLGSGWAMLSRQAKLNARGGAFVDRR